MPVVLNILIVLFSLVAVATIFFILLQTPKQQGLSAGMGGGGNLMGGQGTEGGLVRLSAYAGGLFMFLALLISYVA